MARSDPFWKAIAKKIKDLYRSNPLEWEESRIKEFVFCLEETLQKKIIENPKIASKIGAIPLGHGKGYNLRVIDTSTFRRLIIYDGEKGSKGRSTTKNMFAIFFDYDSYFEVENELNSYLPQKTSKKKGGNIYSLEHGYKLKDNYRDWGDSPDIPFFFGRENELKTLSNWVLKDNCKLIAIIGMGGVGKTNFTLKFGKDFVDRNELSKKIDEHQIDHFDFVIWRSLFSDPSASEIVSDVISFISKKEKSFLPEEFSEQLNLLIEYINRYRCLIILDNVETVLKPGKYAGIYRENRKNYGYLFKKVGTLPHTSCFLLTSREKPIEISLLEGRTRPVRCFELGGLDFISGRRILKDHMYTFSGTEDEFDKIVKFYNGNPLALELVAKHINEVYTGNLKIFLKEGQPIFKDIEDLLEWHFDRLSWQEKELMFWFAIAREPLTIVEFKTNLLSPESKKTFGSNLQSLMRRMPVEKTLAGFTLQPVLMEYMTNRFIQEIFLELKNRNINIFRSHALIQATSKDYIRNAQVKAIIVPLIEKLLPHYGSKEVLKNSISEIISHIQKKASDKEGYTAGNAINLLIQLEVPLNELDFSGLAIWQAYLREAEFHNVNFICSAFKDTIFIESFGSITTVCFNPQSSEHIYAGDQNGEIHVWRVSDSQYMTSYAGHTKMVRDISCSPDGKLLVSCSDDKTIRIWSLNERRCLAVLIGHKDRIRAVQFSPDGKIVASGSEDNTVKIWNPDTMECIHTFHGHSELVSSIAFNPNSKIIMSGSDDGTIRMWDIENEKCKTILNAHEKGIWSIDICVNGEKLASGSEDNCIKVWDLNELKCIHKLLGHSNRIHSINFSNDGKKIVSSSDDNSIKVWDTLTGKCLNTLNGHANGVWSVKFGFDDTHVLSGSEDQTIRVWNIQEEKCLKTIKGYTNSIISVSFNPSGELLASGSEDGIVRLWDWKEKTIKKRLVGHLNWIRSVCFSPDGKLLASCSGDQKIKIWRVDDGQCLTTFDGHSNWVLSITFSPDGKLLASCSQDQSIIIWDIATGKPKTIMREHTGWVRRVIFINAGQLLASASDDNTIKIWDVSNGVCLRTFNEHNGRVHTVAYSPTSILASAGDDASIKIWDHLKLKTKKLLSGHTNRIRFSVFNNDGNILATASEDQSVRLWDIEEGKCINTLEGHQNIVWSVSFHPNNKLLASSSADGTIRLWNLISGQSIDTLQPKRPYENMKLKGSTGLTNAQLKSMESLGAIS